MTRSRILLGVTSGVLAVASAIAVKASNMGSTVGYYITAGSTANCIQRTSPCNYSALSPNTCRTAGLVGKYYSSKTVGGHCNRNKPLSYTQL